ncbi:MAG: hypothetical protein ABI552_15155 [Casimicrobiaceae bacterium]
MKIRHLLQQPDTPDEVKPGDESHYLVVINHHEARLFRTLMRLSQPQQILPHDPDGYFHHAQDSKEISRGKEKPDPNTFFEPIAKALAGASSILIFGSGSGHSSEMEQFVAWLKIHHAALAKRISATLVIDEHHLTEPQLLAKAREFYATA